MTFKRYKYLVLSDLYRYTGKISWKLFLKNLILGEGFKFSFWMRTCHYMSQHPIWKYSFYTFARLLFRRYTYRLGISIPLVTQIDSGFFIGHFGGIVITEHAIIGKNLNISHGVTLGRANRGKNKGYPIIGNNVYIGPGAKITGRVNIGNNVAIGANCVVTKNIPDNAVVVGIPGKIISNEGSIGYVNRVDYDSVLEKVSS